MHNVHMHIVKNSSKLNRHVSKGKGGGLKEFKALLNISFNTERTPPLRLHF